MSAATGPPVVARSRTVWRLALLVALVVTVAGVVWTVLGNRVRPPSSDVIRSTIDLPPRSYGETGGSVVALSPDGRVLAYAGRDQLYRRDLDQTTARAIPGTTEGYQPFFSPDGQWIGFADREGNLSKVSLDSTPPVTVLGDSFSRFQILGAAWGDNNQILIGRLFGPLSRVSASGGAEEQVTTLGPDEVMHTDPVFLPGGESALFTVSMRNQDRHVAVVSVTTGTIDRLLPGMAPRYLPTGHIVFVRGSTLWAVPFDVDRLSVYGEPVPVLEDLGTTPAGRPHMAVGAGSLVYVPRSSVSTELRWVDRDGAVVGVASKMDDQVWTFGLSPNDNVIAFSSPPPVPTIWLFDTERGVRTSFASGADPRWSPDGLRIAFSEGLYGRISAKAASGGEPTVLFQQENGFAWLDDWAPAGDRLAVHVPGDLARGIVVSTAGDTDLTVFDEAEEIDQVVFSPDGQWIAYEANHSGQFEIYVVPYPPTGERIQVSSTGGAQPQWNPNGQELFYLSPDGMLVAVGVETANGFDPDAPRALFDTGLEVDYQREQYAVSSDGERFLINTPVGAAQPSFILVQHWFEELKRLVPTE